MSRKTIIFMVACILLCSMRSADVPDYFKDLKKMEEYYANARASFKTSYDLYAGHSGGKKVQHMETRFYIWDNMFASRSEDMDLVVNNKMAITANHKEKTVLINKYDPKQKKETMKDMMKLFTDSVRSSYIEYKLLSNTASLRKWRLVYKKQLNGIAYTDLEIELPSCRMKQVVLYYQKSFGELYGTSPDGVASAEKPRMEISYHQYEMLQPSDKQLYFTGSHIVKMDGKGNATLTGTFKEYTLANYYKLKP